MDDLRINDERLLADLNTLAEFGATPEGGVNRPALSSADLEARAWFKSEAEKHGFEVQEDGAGNISVVHRSSHPEAKTVMCGSHLDSVPHGGRYDGALGIITALEVLRTIKDSAIDLPHHVEVMNFTDEEGTWIPLMGSRALIGEVKESDVQHTRGGVDAFQERLAASRLSTASITSVKRDRDSLKAWVEVHIEQGMRLEEAGIPVGIVTGIVGIASYWLTFIGKAGHAGTTPMDKRQDAMRGVAEFTRQSRELVMNRFPQGVVNCGNVDVFPGAFNIIPGQTRLALEFRHSDKTKLDAMREALINLALHVAEVENLQVDIALVDIHDPAHLHREVIAAIEGSCEKLGLRSTHLPSFAGHDTQVMAQITRAGMFFVPSVEGISHNPREFTTEEDCINAGNVLLHTVLKLAQE